MAVQDPCWDYGELKFINSSGTTNDPDNSWDYGELKIFHEYGVGALRKMFIPLRKFMEIIKSNGSRSH